MLHLIIFTFVKSFKTHKQQQTSNKYTGIHKVQEYAINEIWSTWFKAHT